MERNLSSKDMEGNCVYNVNGVEEQVVKVIVSGVAIDVERKVLSLP